MPSTPSKKLLLLLVTLFSATGSILVATPSSDAPFDALVGADYDAPVLLEVPTLLSDCGDCEAICGAGRHQFRVDESGGDPSNGENHHNCSAPAGTGWCSVAHGGNDCMAEEDADFAVLTDDQAKELWMVAGLGDASELAALVGELGSGVIFAPERESLQVLSCDGLPYINIPLSASQVGALTQ